MNLIYMLTKRQGIMTINEPNLSAQDLRMMFVYSHIHACTRPVIP